MQEATTNDIAILIREMSGDIKVIRSKAEELTAHQAVANGRLLKLEVRADASDIHTATIAGAASFGRWILGAILTVMTVGASIAGVVLGYLARGH